MSEYEDMYRSMKEEAKAAKKERAIKNMITLNGMICLFSIQCQAIQHHHFRLQIKGRNLDYFPQSGRATWLGTNRWFNIPDKGLEKFIREQYPDHPENKK